MSRDDRIELRDLPPVPPIRWPERLSMTLARHLDRCPRSGYLYVKTGGGAPTPPMDRGSLGHEGFARVMVDWMQALGSTAPGEIGADFTAEEVAGYSDQAGYGGRSDEEIASLTAELLAEVERERPELELPHAERDVARLCVFHVALGLDVNPADVVAVERKFVLELPGSGWPVSGKIDLASMPDSETGQVDDYKTQLHVPPRAEWDPFQQKLYAVLLIWGRPVDRVVCPQCEGTRRRYEAVVPDDEPCDLCRGRGSVEEVGEPLGGQLARVTGRELYPRHDPRKRSDGKLARNEHTWTRLELQEFLSDLDRIGERLSDRLESWKFPARYSESWCGECPDEDACPIPRGYRRFAGHIRSVDEAEEAWAWAQRMKSKVGDTEREVKKFAGDNAVQIRSGDLVWEHALSETKKLKQKGGRTDWDGLEQAIDGALENGDEFRLVDWIKTSNTSTFKKSKVPVDGVGDEQATEVRGGGKSAPADPDERWGPDAPY